MENNVPEALCQERIKRQEERFARDKERMEKTEELLNKVSECQIQLTEISKAHDDKIADHEKRLDEIEHQPKDRMDKIINGFISAIVAFIMGVILNGGV